MSAICNPLSRLIVDTDLALSQLRGEAALIEGVHYPSNGAAHGAGDAFDAVLMRDVALTFDSQIKM